MAKNILRKNIAKAAAALRQSDYTVVFTGSGISVESGIPPYRGPGGIWKKQDPAFLDMRYFLKNPKSSWEMIKKVFYDRMRKARPNAAHRTIAELENRGHVRSVITQNIDNLHQEAGSRTVYEYHGTIRRLRCTDCNKIAPSDGIDLTVLPPVCNECRGVLKPDFVFFGEPIPDEIEWLTRGEAENAGVMLVIGTTGEIKPASLIPLTAKRSQALIIEINVEESRYTKQITDIFLPGRATDILTRLADGITGNGQ
jgi:NAD-dependent deacetylase